MAHTAEDETKKVVRSFVEALGGGRGFFDSKGIFNQLGGRQLPSKLDRLPELESALEGNYGLGFGEIRFKDNDHTVPYIRVPWKSDDENNHLRAQASLSESLYYTFLFDKM